MPRVVGRPHFRGRRTMGASPVTSGQLARRFVASPGVTMPCSTSGVLVDSLKSARRPGSTPSGVETLCEMQVGVPRPSRRPWPPSVVVAERCTTCKKGKTGRARRFGPGGVRVGACGRVRACVGVDRRVRLVCAWFVVRLVCAWFVVRLVCAWFGVCRRAKHGGGGGGGGGGRRRAAAVAGGGALAIVTAGTRRVARGD